MARVELSKEQMAKYNAAVPMRVNAKGDLVTAPVYLDFVGALLKPQKSNFKNDDGTEKSPSYGCTILFQKGQNFAVPRKIMDGIYTEKGIIRQKVDGKPTGPWVGQKDPFLKQEVIGLDKTSGELRKGYVDGGLALRVSSFKKPLVVYGTDRKVVEPPAFDILYSGVLAMCVLNPYYSPTKKELLAKPTTVRGVQFGIMSVVLLNTNTPKWFEGGGRSASIEDLKDIDIDSSLIVDFETGDGELTGADEFASEDEFAV